MYLDMEGPDQGIPGGLVQSYSSNSALEDMADYWEFTKGEVKDRKLEYTGKIKGDDQVIVIDYRDNGKGISNISDEIFEPFNMGGGLGMAHLKKVVENHNGQIHLQRPKHGFHLTISLPITQAQVQLESNSK